MSAQHRRGAGIKGCGLHMIYNAFNTPHYRPLHVFHFTVSSSFISRFAARPIYSTLVLAAKGCGS